MFIAEMLEEIELKKNGYMKCSIPVMNTGRVNRNGRIYPPKVFINTDIEIPPAPPIFNHVLSQDEVEDMKALYSPTTEKARDMFRGYRPRFIGEKY